MFLSYKDIGIKVKIIDQISGTPSCVENAKQAILDKCKSLEADRQERALKSFELKVFNIFAHNQYIFLILLFHRKKKFFNALLICRSRLIQNIIQK